MKRKPFYQPYPDWSRPETNTEVANINCLKPNQFIMICVDNENREDDLTIGKEYILKEDKDHINSPFYVIPSFRFMKYVKKTRFITPEEYRKL